MYFYAREEELTARRLAIFRPQVYAESAQI